MTTSVAHFEFAGPDEDALHRFYGELLGWSVQKMGPGYALVETPDGSPNGSIREAPASEVTIGVEVQELDASLERALELGGTVVMPATDNGWVVKAQVADPAGNLITLIAADKTEL